MAFISMLISLTGSIELGKVRLFAVEVVELGQDASS
jgi:hypothetical protein